MYKYNSKDYVQLLLDNKWAEFKIRSERLMRLSSLQVKKSIELLDLLEKEYFGNGNSGVSKYIGYFYFRLSEYTKSYHFFSQEPNNQVCQLYTVLSLYLLGETRCGYQLAQSLSKSDYEFLSGEPLYIGDLAMFSTLTRKPFKDIFRMLSDYYDEAYVKDKQVSTNDFFHQLENAIHPSDENHLIRRKRLKDNLPKEYTDIYISLYEHILYQKGWDLEIKNFKGSYLFPFSDIDDEIIEQYPLNKIIRSKGSDILSPLIAMDSSVYSVNGIRVITHKPENCFLSLHALIVKDEILIIDYGVGIVDNSTVSITLEDFCSYNDLNPENIIGIVISHAHLDHVGGIVNIDESIPVYMTGITHELINMTMYNELFCYINTVDYYKVISIGQFTVRFVPNGHIIGSSLIDINCNGTRIVYTGDFCLENQKSLPGMDLSDLKGKQIDLLITESTYGTSINSVSKDIQRSIFKYLLKKSVQYKEKVIIPAFAIGRSQEIALILQEISNEYSEGDIRLSVQIGGLAEKVTRFYQNLSGIQIFDATIEGLGNNSLEYTLHNVYVMSSGMISKGSVSYNRINELIDRDIAVIKIGYISSNSVSLDVLTSRSNKNISFYDVPLSAHASYEELIETLYVLKPKIVKTVHGNGIMIGVDEII